MEKKTYSDSHRKYYERNSHIINEKRKEYSREYSKKYYEEHKDQIKLKRKNKVAKTESL